MLLQLLVFSFSLNAQTGDSLGLRQAVQRAIENNNSIQQQRARIEQSRFDTSTTRALLYPNISFVGEGGQKKNSVGTTGVANFGGSPYNEYNLSLKLQQPLFGWGTLSAIRVADYNTKLAEIDLEIAERDLTQNVIQAFYQVMLNQRLYEILESRQKVVEESLATAQQRAQTGRGQRLDVLQVKTEIALLKPKIEYALNQLESSGAILATLLAERGKMELKLRGTLKGLLLADVQRRLDLRQSRLPELERVRLQRQQLDEQRDVIQGKHLPKLMLIGDYGALSYTKADLMSDYTRNWSVMVQLTIPLFSGFQSLHERRSLSEQDRQLDYFGRNTEDRLALTQVESLKAVQSTGSSLVYSEEAARLAEESMTEARRNYRLATIDFLQYLQVQRSALEALSSLDSNKFNNIVALSKYFVATGQPLTTLIDMLEEKR